MQKCVLLKYIPSPTDCEMNQYDFCAKFQSGCIYERSISRQSDEYTVEHLTLLPEQLRIIDGHFLYSPVRVTNTHTYRDLAVR